MKNGFVDSIDQFEPRPFQAGQGAGLFRSHTHESDEITLILEGDGYYSSERQNLRVTKGHLLLIPSGLYHGYVCLNTWKGISTHFFSREAPSYCQFLLRIAYQNQPGQILMAQLNGKYLDRALLALLQLEEEWSSEQSHHFSYDLMSNALETLLLLYHGHTAKASNQKTSEEEDSHQIMQLALKEMHSKFHTSLKIADLAASHFVSESFFRKKFIESVGVCPKQYLISLRINEAKRLLRHTNKPIEFISSEVGFTSTSRFHDLFLKHVGMTPLEWRKQQ